MYLTVVGPPPLRFEPAASHDPEFIEELTLPQPKNPETAVAILPTNSPAVPAPVPVPIATNKVSTAASSTGFLSDGAKRAEGLESPASNLLSIMPQMMTEYLKPIRVGAAPVDSNTYQPGETILVPAELGFVPPTPGESRAIYESR